MKKCYIGLYWGPRAAEIDEIVFKVTKTFGYLSSCHNSFNNWYKTSKPKKGQVINPIDLSARGIRSLLIEGQNYNDDGELNEDIGYSLYLKSFRDFSQSHILSIHCGNTNKRLTNNFFLSMSKSNTYLHLSEFDRVLDMYRHLVKIWMPERGIIKSEEEEEPVFSEIYKNNVSD